MSNRSPLRQGLLSCHKDARVIYGRNTQNVTWQAQKALRLSRCFARNHLRRPVVDVRARMKK